MRLGFGARAPFSQRASRTRLGRRRRRRGPPWLFKCEGAPGVDACDPNREGLGGEALHPKGGPKPRAAGGDHFKKQTEISCRSSTVYHAIYIHRSHQHVPDSPLHLSFSSDPPSRVLEASQSTRDGARALISLRLSGRASAPQHVAPKTAVAAALSLGRVRGRRLGRQCICDAALRCRSGSGSRSRIRRLRRGRRRSLKPRRRRQIAHGSRRRQARVRAGALRRLAAGRLQR